ncbi:MAG TPA: PAS domain S-box protein [Kiritimatiellia bacterium]|nr:PAS domain S-box protein [Kiritimatiellia bacterium]HRZ11922.1 PAS domain S-box protein [Kiritimatiellia bacterium]HSA17272.1 PAS domain S-box protein [Kiritimatiellia bacterium]
MKFRSSMLWLLTLPAIMLIAGATVWASRRADGLLRRELIQQARVATLAINVERVQNLQGSDADLRSPDYLRLKEQLTNMRKANDRCRFLYLMGRRADGMIFFFVDSEPADSPDYSPPGQTYDEVSRFVTAVFDSEKESSEGPFTDRWGTWVSAFVPMLQPETGRLLAVFGMDIDARDWRKIVMARAALPLTLAAVAILLGLGVIGLHHANRRVRHGQEQLLESRDNLQSVLTSSPVGMLVIDADERILFFNAVAEQMVRRSEGSLGALKCGDFIRCVNRERDPRGCGSTDLCPACRLNLAIRSALAEDGDPAPRHGEAEVCMESHPAPRWLSFRASSVVMNKQRCAVLAIDDITEQKHASEMVREALARFSAVVESNPLVAVESYAPDGTILQWNQAATRLFGATQEEAVGNRMQDLLQEDPETGGQNTIAEIWRTGQGSPPAERRVTAKNGEERWLYSVMFPVFNKGRVSEVFCMDVDITDRKRAEEKAVQLAAESDRARIVLLSILEDERRGQAERARLASAIEQAGEAVVITDAQGNIQYVNPAFTRVSGYAREEVIGKNPRILKGGRKGEDFYRQLWDTISSGAIWTGRLVNRRKDGVLYTEDVSISPVHDAHGKIVNYVAVKRDVSRELDIEKQLAQAQKMEVIGTLAGGIAHDFNNLLQSIRGFTELALSEDEPEAAQREDMLEVRKAAESAAALTRQLLAFSRRQVLEQKALDFNELIENMGKMLRRMIGEDVALNLNMEPRLWSVRADPGQMEQVILNLAVNARDAMPRGGSLTISTTNLTFAEEDLAAHPDARVGRFIRISVGDTGTGMSEEIQRHVFEPFFTTKPTGKGTGMGLSSVYGIVRQHEGWVHLYSELGAGTVFHIYLPATAEAVARVSAEPPLETLRGCGERILVVEDDDSVRNLMAHMLGQNGYETLLAASAEEAVDIFTREKGHFALVCSDVVLPHRSGFDLVEELKKEKPALLVLMVSGYTDDRTRWPQIREKGWRYLQKPVGLRLLLRTLAEMLRPSPGGA